MTRADTIIRRPDGSLWNESVYLRWEAARSVSPLSGPVPSRMTAVPDSEQSDWARPLRGGSLTPPAPLHRGSRSAI